MCGSRLPGSESMTSTNVPPSAGGLLSPRAAPATSAAAATATTASTAPIALRPPPVATFTLISPSSHHCLRQPLYGRQARSAQAGSESWQSPNASAAGRPNRPTARLEDSSDAAVGPGALVEVLRNAVRECVEHGRC